MKKKYFLPNAGDKLVQIPSLSEFSHLKIIHI